jgi:hypothetical protein
MSGRATIAAGASSKAITVTGLTTGISTGILRIYLNRALPTSAVVAWMVIG